MGRAALDHDDEPSRDFSVRIEPAVDGLGIQVAGRFAIPQRAIPVPGVEGNTLWDCISLVTSDAVRHLERLGGVARLAISHPHFYSSMVEWSDVFGGIPIFIHDADREWVSRK